MSPATFAWLCGGALLALGCRGGTSAASGADAGVSGAGGAWGSADGGAGAGGDACAADFTPCGGTLLGAWRSDPRCAPKQPTMAVNGCMDETFDLDGVVSTTTWTFAADKTFTVDLRAQGTATVHAPAACLVDANGLQLSCNGMAAGAMYAGRVSFVGGKPGAPTCQEAPAACTCVIPVVPAPVSLHGTYTISGTTVTPDFGMGGDAIDYCVSGDTLRMRSHGMDDAPGVGDFMRQ